MLVFFMISNEGIISSIFTYLVLNPQTNLLLAVGKQLSLWKKVNDQNEVLRENTVIATDSSLVAIRR